MALKMNFSWPGASNPRFARLLNLDLQFLCGVRIAVAVLRRNTQRLDQHGSEIVQ